MFKCKLRYKANQVKTYKPTPHVKPISKPLQANAKTQVCKRACLFPRPSVKLSKIKFHLFLFPPSRKKKNKTPQPTTTPTKKLPETEQQV